MALMWEVYHSAFEDEPIIITSTYHRSENEAHKFAREQLELLEAGTPVCIREIDADLRLLNPIATASEDVTVLRKSTKEE